jgi:hypothetical protein
MKNRKHFLYKLDKEERSHYMKYIKSKEGMRENATIRNCYNEIACFECRRIANKLGWQDLIK